MESDSREMEEKVSRYRMGKGMEKDMLQRMEKEAVYQLLHYHEKDRKQKIKDMIKRAAGRYVPPKDLIFWPTGLLAGALMEKVKKGSIDKNGENGAITEALTTYFDRWINAGMPIYYVDDALAGVPLMDLYLLTKEEKYKKGADKMAEYLLALEEKEADEKGSIPYRPAQKNQHIYVDGIGMMCPFLIKYGISFGQQRAVETAMKQIENMLSYGMDEITGLPYHGFRYENRVKYGIIGWGRAAGWLLYGLADSLRYMKEGLPESGANFKEENAAFVKRMEAAIRQLYEAIKLYQKKNGAFSWQLEAMEGPEDSSATAMLAYGIMIGIKNGVIQDAEAGRLVESARAYLKTCEKQGKIYHCSGECLGFSQYPQIYGAYPWSLGPAYGVLSENENEKL